MAACLACGVSPECPACRDRRDAHTSALQRRFLRAQRPEPRLTLTAPELVEVVRLLGLGLTVPCAMDRIQARRASLPFDEKGVA
jgi:hypothetical protein